MTKKELLEKIQDGQLGSIQTPEGYQEEPQYASDTPNSIRPRHGSPEFYRLLDQMAETHDKKSHDYASNENPFGNYHFAGEMARMFSYSSQDAGFAGRLAEKIYRIAMLESSNKIPQNESIEDTEKDVAVITLLWITSRRELRNKKLNQRIMTQENEQKQIEDKICCQIIEISQGLSSNALNDMSNYLTVLRERNQKLGEQLSPKR